MMTEEITELATILAEDRGIDEINSPESTHKNVDIYVLDDEEENIGVYTDEFQQIFNRWYDYYYDLIQHSMLTDSPEYTTSNETSPFSD